MVLGFDEFPNEIFLAVELHSSCGDLLVLARCCRRLAEYFLGALSRHADQHLCGRRALFWAVANSQMATLRRLITPETDLNIVWHSIWRSKDYRDLIPTARGYELSCDAPCGLSPLGNENEQNTSGEQWVGWSLVHVAAAVGDVGVLEMLLDKDLKVTPLGCMGICDCASVPRKLGVVHLQSTNPSNIQYSWTVLHVALCRGHVEAAKLLFRRGHKGSMMSPAIWTDFDPRMLRLVRAGQRRIQPQPQQQQQQQQPVVILPPVTAAPLLNDLPPVHVVQPVTPPPMTPPPPLPVSYLHGACISGCLEYIKWLIEEVLRGKNRYDEAADVDARDSYGQTALCYAYLYGHWDCFHYLIDKGGADVDQVTWQNYPARHTHSGPEFMLLDAVCRLRFKNARYIMTGLGANPDIMLYMPSGPDRHLLAELCCRAWSRSEDPMEEGVQLLEEVMGAVDSRRPPDPEGLFRVLTSALVQAAKVGNHTAIRRLVDKGASANGLPDIETTGLLAATTDTRSHRRNRTLDLLIKLGADPNLPDGKGRRPLWELWDVNIHGKHLRLPSQKACVELLIRYGARPFRGTDVPDSASDIDLDAVTDPWTIPYHRQRVEWHASVGIPASRLRSPASNSLTRVYRPVTPLDKLFHSRELGSFRRLLDRSGGKAGLGSQDILSYWDSISLSGVGTGVIGGRDNNKNKKKGKEELDLMLIIIDLDERGAIAQYAQSPLRSLLAMDPVPRDLIFKLLDQGIDPDTHGDLSIVAQAMGRGLDTAFVKKLLQCGADPRAPTFNKPILAHVIGGTYSSVMTPEQLLDIAGFVLDAGVSIYESLNALRRLGLPESVPRTYLAYAIHEQKRCGDMVRMFLEREPLSGKEKDNEEVLPYLKQVCRQGHRIALETLVSEAGDKNGSIRRLISEQSALLTHVLLDGMCQCEKAEEAVVNEAIDCLGILLRHTQDDILDDPPGASDDIDTRTIREKLKALLFDEVSDSEEAVILSRHVRVRLTWDGESLPTVMKQKI